MKLFSLLMPREGHFFSLFNQHAALIVEGSRTLVALLQEYDDAAGRPPRIERIQKLEHDADDVTRETISLLHTIFVTPLDRDDIHRLISRMDDILDLMQDTTESLILYDIRTLTPEALELAKLLQTCCERLQTVVGLLSNMKNAPQALAICEEIDKLESDADRVMRDAISRLFREEQDTRQVIKLKAVYEMLETATDKCQDVANVIESVVLENA
jgi:uncharacterized protein